MCGIHMQLSCCAAAAQVDKVHGYWVAQGCRPNAQVPDSAGSRKQALVPVQAADGRQHLREGCGGCCLLVSSSIRCPLRGALFCPPWLCGMLVQPASVTSWPEPCVMQIVLPGRAHTCAVFCAVQSSLLDIAQSFRCNEVVA